MIYVLMQSVVILSLVFGGGLWLGGALSKWTEKPRPVQIQPTVAEPEAPVYHGFELSPESMPEPAPAQVAVAEPPPPPPIAQAIRNEPLPVKRWEMLYPVNQFGTISVTRARIG